MRIDVVDPGSERLAVVAALVGAGYDVATAELRDVEQTRADLLVLAADAPGALAMLRRLRDDGRRPDVPVILLGAPEGTTPIPEGPAFGAELVLPRPIDEARLVLGARRLLRDLRDHSSNVERVPEHTLELREREAAEERDDPSGVSAIRSMGEQGERADDDWSARHGRADAAASGSLVDHATRERDSAPAPRASSPPQPTGVSQIERRSEVPVSVVTTGTGSSQVSSTVDLVQAPISDALRALLIAADRRVFPGLAAIDVSIPAGEASARELVPDELFDDASPEGEGEDEGLFVVAPLSSVLGASVSSAPPRVQRPASEPPAERDKKTSPGTPLSLGQGYKIPNPLPPRVDAVAIVPDDRAFGPLDAAGARRLPLAPGAMMRALATLVLSRASTRAIVTSPALDVEMTFSRGELAKIEGPVATAALARLGRSAPDEASARARLATLVERGELTTAGELLALARGERDVLARALLIDEGEAVFHATRDEDLPSRLGSTGRAIGQLVSSFRGRDAIDALLAPMGPRGRLEPTRALGGTGAAFGVSADLTRFFETADEGLSRVDLARAARLAPEIPGVAALFAAAGALVVTPGVAEVTAVDARVAEQIVREHAARADEADYFVLLGVNEDAGEAEIAAAHERRQTLLATLPLDEVGLDALEPLRATALAALDEALEVLGDPGLREAYAHALAGASALRPGAARPTAV